MPRIEYEWALYEMPDEVYAAGGSAPTKEEAEREGYHYLEQYALDDVALRLEFFEVTRKSLGGIERVPNACGEPGHD
jgi:hypothetical protein